MTKYELIIEILSKTENSSLECLDTIINNKLKKLNEKQLIKCLNFIDLNCHYKYSKISWTKLASFIDSHCLETEKERYERLLKLHK